MGICCSLLCYARQAWRITATYLFGPLQFSWRFPWVLRRRIGYVYSPFARERQIRLAKLRPRTQYYPECEIEVFDLDKAPPFKALSYTHVQPFPFVEEDQQSWDNQKLKIWIGNGWELSISPNLFLGLIQFDELGCHGYFWIDAICINQQDIPEKTAQVMMMGDIYATAEQVTVWLGPEYFDSLQALPLMDSLLVRYDALLEGDKGALDDYANSLANHDACESLWLEHDTPEAWNRLWDFFDRSYFQRTWTLQEALLGDEIIFICGSKIIPWERMKRFLDYIQKSNWEIKLGKRYSALYQQAECTPDMRISSTIVLKDLLVNEDAAMQRYLSHIAHGAEQQDLLLAYISLLFGQIRARSATNSRDKVYGIYGIVSRLCDQAGLSNPLIHPNYTISIETVFTSNIRSLLSRSKSLLIFSGIEDRSNRRLKDLPSWVPDLTTVGPSTLLGFPPGNLFNASKASFANLLSTEDPQTMSLVGHFVDQVVETSGLHDQEHPYHTFMEGAMKFLQSLPKDYTTGQDRFEVFWRTLINNVAKQKTPADSGASHGLFDMLLIDYSLVLTPAWDEGVHEYETACAYLKSFLESVRTSPEALRLIPSLDDVLHRTEAFRDFYRPKPWPPGLKSTLPAKNFKPCNLKTSKTHGFMYESEARALQFASQLGISENSYQRLMITAGGFFGYGPKSTMVGDRVFVLEGARVPFLLRQVFSEDQDILRHEVIGEAYVHGIMQGEILQRGVPIKMDLLLV